MIKISLRKARQLAKEIEKESRPFLDELNALRKKLEQETSEQDAFSLLPSKRQELARKTESQNYERRVEILGSLFPFHGTVVYPGIGKDFVFKKWVQNLSA